MAHRRIAAALVVVAALAVGSPAGANDDVAIVGDSIIDRSRAWVRNAIEPAHDIVWYETQNSATVARMGPLVLAEVSRSGGPDIALVELGIGNAFWGTDADDFRIQVRNLTHQLLQHVDCVRWFEQKPGGNLAYPNVNRSAVRFNRIVREEVNAVPGARTVHYESWSRLAGDAAFMPDLLHLNPRGKRALARLSRQAVEGCDPAVTSGRFWDVPDRHWAATAIDWVGGQHLIDGYPNGTFRADVGGIAPVLRRNDWVRALWRREGRPTGLPAPPWPDVGAGDRQPLAWAWDAEVTQVPGGARFHPTSALRREDAVQWLYRAAGRPDPSAYPPHGLVDVPAGLARAVRWAKGVGIVTVPDGGRFEPRRTVSRAAAAVYLYRAAHPLPPPPPPAPPTTLPPPTTTTVPPTTTTTVIDT